MNRLIRRLAKNSSVTPGKAADQVDKVVHEILKKLRKGEKAPLPGVGVLIPGLAPQFIEEPSVNTAPKTRRRSR